MGRNYRIQQATSRHEKLNRTYQILSGKIRENASNPHLRELALGILKAMRVPERNESAEIKALARFIRAHVQFRRDPFRVETIADPEDTLALGAGDCDDMAVLIGSILQSAGYPVRLRVVGKTRPAHVFIEAWKKRAREWQPVDISRPDGNFFARIPRQKIEKVIDLDGNIADCGTDMGSWVSEGLEKVFGETGKQITEAVDTATEHAMKNIEMASRFIPGKYGEALSKSSKAMQVLKHSGEDPAKMSEKSIMEVYRADPIAGQELLAMRDAALRGEIGPPALRRKRRRKLKRKRKRRKAAAAIPAPAKDNTLLYLALAGAGAYLYTQRKRRK